MQKMFKLLAIPFLVIFLGTSSYVIWYEMAPETIQVSQVAIEEGEFNVTGIAKELIVQDVTKKGVWASRGYNIYFKANEENMFHRIGKVPIPFGISYLANSRILRYLLNRQEVLELIIHPSGNIIAFGGGMIFRSSDNGQSFDTVAKLAHFGLGEGRGVMPQGYTGDADGNIYWGEYWRNSDKQEVRLMKGKDGGNIWEPIYTFSKGDIRHIHAVQYDPYFNAIWVATGDSDNECLIMYSTDGGQSFTKIGSGAQKWRAVSLMFTKRSVCWGMDGSTGSSKPAIQCWNRKTKETEQLATLDSDAFYSATLDNGAQVLSTDGLDGQASLWTSQDEKSWTKSHSWARDRENHYGTIRMISNKNELIITNLNLSHYNNDLLMLQLLREKKLLHILKK